MAALKRRLGSEAESEQGGGQNAFHFFVCQQMMAIFFWGTGSYGSYDELWAFGSKIFG